VKTDLIFYRLFQGFPETFFELINRQASEANAYEFASMAEQSLGVGMIKLVVETKKRTPERVRQLVDKARSELADEAVQRQVLDLIETIVLYKLPLINRQELARMFGLNELRKTRYYQEVREEVREELQQEVRQAVRQELQQEVRQAVRQELQQEVRQEEALELIKRLLQRRLGAVNPELQEQVNLLSVAQLENLAEALLDFSNEADLVTWLSENSNQLD
jgi:predicted transposase YdaD